MRNSNTLLTQFFIIILGALLFIPFTGSTHLFDWDEINFAECAREMIATNDYLNVQINYEVFWEKPPLFIWMQVISMKLFGINEFAARFPNAICGIITLLVLFNIGRKTYDEKFGILWTIAYAGSLLPFMYFKSGIIDPWFNLFILLGIYNISLTFLSIYKQNQNKRVILSAIFIGLAILTKGPAALIIFLGTAGIFLVFNHFKFNINIFQILIFILVLALTGGAWFIIQILNGNYDMVYDFIIYQIRLFNTKDAGHGGFLMYHFVVIILGVFPASIIALKAFKLNSIDNSDQRLLKKWMIILLAFVLVLFTIVKTKIVHYSSLCYFPVTYLAAYTLYMILNNKMKWNKLLSITLLIISIIYSSVIISLPFIYKYKHQLLPFIKDQFGKEALLANAGWTGFELLCGIPLIIGCIIAIFLIKNKNTTKGIYVLFASSALFMYLSMTIITKKVEIHSQNAAIEFYKNISNKDCYIQTIGFKSYAHLFYGKLKKPANKNYYKPNRKEWLLHGDIDKPAYFVAKIHKTDGMDKIKDLTMLYEKNGFVFYERKIKSQSNQTTGS